MTSHPPRIVAFGGGTGMASLLAGLKAHTPDITAVVAVSDDGGSSGRLRKEMDVLPPGDLRNCLVALAPDDSLMGRLFQYRFQDGELAGHPLGNLLIAALHKLTGDFGSAVTEAGRMLGIRGAVIPSANRKVALVAEHGDGSKSTGEVEISRSGKRISRLVLRPSPGALRLEVADAIARADIFVFGPGSLYTSVIPNLLLDGTVEAVLKRGSPRLYVCNIMTQPGETSGFTVADHLAALEAHTRPGFIDHALVNEGTVPEDLRARYAAQGQFPVLAGEDLPRELAVIRRDVVSTTDFVRHDPAKLAEAIVAVAVRSSTAGARS